MTAKKFLTMMTGAYGDELKKQLIRPQEFDFEKKIIDFSEVGDNQNESTADLAIRLFTKMLEKEMCFIPGGLFRGAFSGVGIPIIMKQKPMEEDQIRLKPTSSTQDPERYPSHRCLINSTLQNLELNAHLSIFPSHRGGS